MLLLLERRGAESKCSLTGYVEAGLVLNCVKTGHIQISKFTESSILSMTAELQTMPGSCKNFASNKKINSVLEVILAKVPEEFQIPNAHFQPTQ